MCACCLECAQLVQACLSVRQYSSLDAKWSPKAWNAHAKWTSQEPIPKSRPDKAGARLLHGRSAAKTSGNQVYELTSVLNNYRNG